MVPMAIDQFISCHSHQPRQLTRNRQARKSFVVERSKKDLHQQVFSILLVRYALTDIRENDQSKTIVECAISFIPGCFLIHALQTLSCLIFASHLISRLREQSVTEVSKKQTSGHTQSRKAHVNGAEMARRVIACQVGRSNPLTRLQGIHRKSSTLAVSFAVNKKIRSK